MPYPKEVWHVNQVQSRTNSNPPVPPDQSKVLRRYLILGTYAARKNLYVTAIPFQTPDPGVIHKVFVKENSDPKIGPVNGLDHDSWAVTCEIVTVLNSDLSGTKCLGILDDTDYIRIINSVATYLGHICPRPPTGIGAVVKVK